MASKAQSLPIQTIQTIYVETSESNSSSWRVLRRLSQKFFQNWNKKKHLF